MSICADPNPAKALMWLMPRCPRPVIHFLSFCLDDEEMFVCLAYSSVRSDIRYHCVLTYTMVLFDLAHHAV